MATPLTHPFEQKLAQVIGNELALEWRTIISSRVTMSGSLFAAFEQYLGRQGARDMQTVITNGGNNGVFAEGVELINMVGPSAYNDFLTTYS